VEQQEHWSNAELLATLAGKGAAELLIKKFSGLTDLAKASFDELTQVQGIGEGKAKAIKSAFLLAQRLSKEAHPEAPLMVYPDCAP
jgi:DNA repair protein RadC